MSRRTIGVILLLLATFHWALMGNTIGWLYTAKNMSPDMVTFLKTAGAGALLLIYTLIKYKRINLVDYKEPGKLKPLLAYGLGGVLLTQYSYSMAVFYSNAPTTGLIHYTGAFMVIGYLAFRERKAPKATIVIAFLVAILGLFILVSGGDLSRLDINTKALFWGIGAAIGYACFVVAPVSLLKSHPSSEVVGLGMIMASLIFLILKRPDLTSYSWDLASSTAFIIIIVIGTFLSFISFMEGTIRTGPDISGIFGLTDPVFSVILGLTIFGIVFTKVDFLGMLLILGSVGALAVIND